MAEVDYTYDLQKMFIEFLVTEPELYARCRNICDSDFFDAPLPALVPDPGLVVICLTAISSQFL